MGKAFDDMGVRFRDSGCVRFEPVSNSICFLLRFFIFLHRRRWRESLFSRVFEDQTREFWSRKKDVIAIREVERFEYCRKSVYLHLLIAFVFFRYSRDYVVIQIEEFENMEDITIRSSSNVSILFKIASKLRREKIRGLFINIVKKKLNGSVNLRVTWPAKMKLVYH